jgi:prophage regulatory protein
MNRHDLMNTARIPRQSRQPQCGPTIVFLRQDEVERRTGLSTSQRDRLEAAGLFPSRVPISSRSVGWVEDEITRWQLARIDVRDNVVGTAQARLERMPPNRRPQPQRPHLEEQNVDPAEGVIYGGSSC